MTLLIKFKIFGRLRYLSHSETLRLFHRACVRAGIEAQYSQGFNPRPKLSLPLPRSVGVESDDELLVVGLSCQVSDSFKDERDFQMSAYISEVERGLSAVLPQGCKVISVEIVTKKLKYAPSEVLYTFAVSDKYPIKQLEASIENIVSSESLVVQRAKKSAFKRKNWSDKSIGFKNMTKNVDVRGFIKSIDFEQGTIAVKSAITSSGTIRVDEILKLLELSTEELVSPVRRSGVKWKNN